MPGEQLQSKEMNKEQYTQKIKNKVKRQHGLQEPRVRYKNVVLFK